MWIFFDHSNFCIFIFLILCFCWSIQFQSDKSSDGSIRTKLQLYTVYQISLRNIFRCDDLNMNFHSMFWAIKKPLQTHENRLLFCKVSITSVWILSALIAGFPFGFGQGSHPRFITYVKNVVKSEPALDWDCNPDRTPYMFQYRSMLIVAANSVIYILYLWVELYLQWNNHLNWNSL